MKRLCGVNLVSRVSGIEHPQAYVLELKNAQKNAEGIIVKYGKFDFGLVNNVDGFLKEIMAIPLDIREWYVVATDGAAKNGWMDVELYECNGLYKNTEIEVVSHSFCEVLEYLLDMYISIFNKTYEQRIGLRMSTADLVVVRAHRKCGKDMKYSVHVTSYFLREGHIWMFRDISVEKSFMEYVYQEIEREAATDVRARILYNNKQPDNSVYNRNSALRLAYCCKNGSSESELRVDNSLGRKRATPEEAFPLYHKTLFGNIVLCTFDMTKARKRRLIVSEDDNDVEEGQAMLAMENINDNDEEVPPLPSPIQQSFITDYGSDVEIGQASSQVDSVELIDDEIPRLRTDESMSSPVVRNARQPFPFGNNDAANPPRNVSLRITPSPKISGTFDAFPDDRGLIGKLRQRLFHCPRVYDVIRYVEGCEGLEMKQFKKWSSEFPDTWIFRFEPSESSPCGIRHERNGSKIEWRYQRIDEPVETVDGSGRPTTGLIRGFGRLLHQCLDPECRNAIKYIDYYGGHYAFNITPYFIPPDTIYKVIVNYGGLRQACGWLVNRLCGDDGGFQKLAFMKERWYAWDGLIWRARADVFSELSKFLYLYLQRVTEAFAVEANEEREVIDWIMKIKHALGLLGKFVSDFKNVEQSVDKAAYNMHVSVFDSLASKGIVALNNYYLDIEKGRFIEPRPDLYITQLIGTRYLSNCEVCDDRTDFPLVEAFIASLFDDRPDDVRLGIIDNLQMFLGYALTGLVSHHIVLFLHGEGRNGKGVLMRALRAVFDARDIPDNDEYKPFAMLGHDTGIRETLRFSSLEQRLENVTPSKRRRSVLWGFDESRLFTTVDKKVILQTARAPENAHTANLMALPGARYVLIDELNEIESIDFAKLKQLSGGDALNVRAAYGRENYTVPHPTHTFIISTNSLPAMPVDRAVTERVKVLSFNLFFNTQKREGMALEHNERYGDPLIEQKTQSIEFRRQFLRWLLHGALQFYRRGRRLDWCEGIQQDTSKFWQSVDYIGQFVDEMCDVERGDIAIDEALINQRKMYVSCMELYSAFKQYAKDKGVLPSVLLGITQPKFDSRILSYKVLKDRTRRYGLKRVLYYFGIRIRKHGEREEESSN